MILIIKDLHFSRYLFIKIFVFMSIIFYKYIKNVKNTIKVLDYLNINFFLIIKFFQIYFLKYLILHNKMN